MIVNTRTTRPARSMRTSRERTGAYEASVGGGPKRVSVTQTIVSADRQSARGHHVSKSSVTGVSHPTGTSPRRAASICPQMTQ
jgi:hypothetical protein